MATGGRLAQCPAFGLLSLFSVKDRISNAFDDAIKVATDTGPNNKDLQLAQPITLCMALLSVCCKCPALKFNPHGFHFVPQIMLDIAQTVPISESQTVNS